MPDLQITPGLELTEEEIAQINEAKHREFALPPMEKGQLKDSVFFLLKDKGQIMALGQLEKISPVIFGDQSLSIMGIGGIIANKKGSGFGKQIMTAIKEYLISDDLTGIGFCKAEHKGFYEKSGFRIDANLIKRFVYFQEGKRVINNDEDYVFFLERIGKISQVLASNPNEDFRLSRPPNW